MLVSLLILSIAYAIAQDIKPATDPEEFRYFTSEYNPVENSLSAAGVKIVVDANGQNNSASGEIDFAGFKFVASTLNKQIALGFSALSVEGGVQWSNGPNGDGKLIYSLKGAWAELILGISHIFLYEEKNGETGFQYNLGDNVWDCVADKVDCILLNSGIEVGTLDFSPISVVSSACPTGSGYSTDCRVWTISSTGSFSYLGQSIPVFELSFRAANQKVISGTHQIGPDYGKIDWTIRYPYTAKGQDKTKGNVAVAAYVGGKAGTAGIVGGTFQGKNSYIFQGDNNKAAVLAWDGTATLGTTTTKESAIYVDGISGESIAKYDLTNADLVSKIVIGSWKISVGLASLGGWTSELVLLSWDGIGPDAVVYDPTMGMASTTEYTTNGSSFLMPSFLSLVCTLVLSRLF